MRRKSFGTMAGPIARSFERVDERPNSRGSSGLLAPDDPSMTPSGVDATRENAL